MIYFPVGCVWRCRKSQLFPSSLEEKKIISGNCAEGNESKGQGLNQGHKLSKCHRLKAQKDILEELVIKIRTEVLTNQAKKMMWGEDEEFFERAVSLRTRSEQRTSKKKYLKGFTQSFQTLPLPYQLSFNNILNPLLLFPQSSQHLHHGQISSQENQFLC